MMLLTNWSIVSMDNETGSTGEDLPTLRAPGDGADLVLLGLATGPRGNCTVGMIPLQDVQYVQDKMIRTSHREYRLSSPKPAYEAAFPGARGKLLSSLRERLARREQEKRAGRYSARAETPLSMGAMLKGYFAIYAACVVLFGSALKIAEWSGTAGSGLSDGKHPSFIVHPSGEAPFKGSGERTREMNWGIGPTI